MPPEEDAYLAFKGKHKSGGNFFRKFLPKALVGGAGLIAVTGAALVKVGAATGVGFGMTMGAGAIAAFSQPFIVLPILALLGVAAMIYVPLYALRISDALTLSRDQAVFWEIRDHPDTRVSDAFTMENVWRPGHWKHGKFSGNTGKRAHLVGKRKSPMFATEAPEDTVYLSVVQPDGQIRYLHYEGNKVQWHHARRTRWRLINKNDIEMVQQE